MFPLASRYVPRVHQRHDIDGGRTIFVVSYVAFRRRTVAVNLLFRLSTMNTAESTTFTVRRTPEFGK